MYTVNSTIFVFWENLVVYAVYFSVIRLFDGHFVLPSKSLFLFFTGIFLASAPFKTPKKRNSMQNGRMDIGMEKQFFNRPAQEALTELNTSEQGLSAQEAKKRLEQYGPNKLSEAKRKSPLAVFLEQFKDLLVIILIIAAIISMVSGNMESTLVIFAVLILNAILGTVQYFKAEKSLESLKAMSSPSAKVLRDGARVEIPVTKLCPVIFLFWKRAISSVRMAVF